MKRDEPESGTGLYRGFRYRWWRSERDAGQWGSARIAVWRARAAACEAPLFAVETELSRAIRDVVAPGAVVTHLACADAVEEMRRLIDDGRFREGRTHRRVHWVDAVDGCVVSQSTQPGV